MADLNQIELPNGSTYNFKDDSAVANITRSGTTFTATKRDGTTFTFTQQDNNTTYTFTNGGTNKFTVTPSGGTAQDVTFTASDSTKLPLTGGTVTGVTKFKGRAASQILQSRSLVGLSTDATALDGLYLQYGNTVNDTVFFGATGGGAISSNGTQYSGNAATATTTNALSYTGEGNSCITAQQTANSFNGRSGWGTYLICNHGNGTTYYHQMLRFDFFKDKIELQRRDNGTLKGWKPLSIFTEETPTTGQVVITDGTDGGVKSSGYTIEKSVPSDAVFTDHYAWSDITGKPNTYPPSSHNHSEIVTVGDQRSTATTPNDYSNRIIFKGLKGNSTIGSPSTDTYSYLLGLRGWSDSSGGNSHELAFNNSGIYTRNGATTTWGAWQALGRFTAAPTTGQVMITDGTTGGMKSSGYTIAKSVPSTAVFTDTTYTLGTSGNTVTLTPAGGTAQSITVPYATSAGSATDSTKVAKAGDLMTGTLRIESVNGSYGEGLRINKGNGGYSTLLFNANAGSTSGTQDGAWWVGANNATYSRRLMIAHNGSGATTTYFYADSASQVSPHLRVGNNILCDGVIAANQTNGTSGGISLYGGASYVTNYGIAFRTTTNMGKHGYVQGDWATYFTMDGADSRGWAFKNVASGKGIMASISSLGHAVFNGSVTIGGNTTNTSGARMEYNATTQAIDFVFN